MLLPFFKNHADDFNPGERLRWDPYPAARERLGEPAFDECFGYVPLLALGGPETVEYLEKVKLREHIYLISLASSRGCSNASRPWQVACQLARAAASGRCAFCLSFCVVCGLKNTGATG